MYSRNNVGARGNVIVISPETLPLTNRFLRQHHHHCDGQIHPSNIKLFETGWWCFRVSSAVGTRDVVGVGVGYAAVRSVLLMSNRQASSVGLIELTSVWADGKGRDGSGRTENN